MARFTFSDAAGEMGSLLRFASAASVTAASATSFTIAGATGMSVTATGPGFQPAGQGFSGPITDLAARDGSGAVMLQASGLAIDAGWSTSLFISMANHGRDTFKGSGLGNLLVGGEKADRLSGGRRAGLPGRRNRE